MSWKPWWQIAVPHEDIREGNLEEAVFAANLGDVVQDKGPLDYRDSELFFTKTHFTVGLTNLISAVLSKLSGERKGDTVIQLKTPFGGGKTHALLALYHTFKHRDKVSQFDVLEEILKEDKLEAIPDTKVVVFVGEYADPLKGRTLWGEIGHQLGRYDLVEKHDKKRIAPGKNIIFNLIGQDQPVLILMDEVLQYLVRAMGVEVQEGTLKGQTSAFLKALTEAVATLPNCALIATLPSSVMERFEEPEKAERLLVELQKIFGRVEKVYTPVEGEEIYEVIRKRLFEDLGDVADHRLVAEKYFAIYQKLGEDVPYDCREISYKERMVKAFPFHPETIDILFERWATIPTFQRTRGALRLLAEIVADLFNREHSAPLIQPAHINLAKSTIRREFIKHIGNEFEGVIASDIGGPGAKAPEIDRGMGTEYAKFKVASGLASSIFYYSHSGGERKGVSAQRLRVAFLREGIPSAIVADALRRLENDLWFLHSEANFYYFSNVVGLNRVILDKEEAVKDEDIDIEIRKRIEKIGGTDFEVLIWPKSNADIPDSKKLKLVIVPHSFVAGDPSTQEFIEDIINKYSTGFRTYKNTLLFLIADQNEYKGFRRSIRRLLALTAIKMDKKTLERLTDADKERAYQMLKDADASAFARVLSLYRFLAKASRDGSQTMDMGIPTIGRLTLSSRARDYLKDRDILLSKISPKVLFDKTFSKDDERKSVMELKELFLKIPELYMLEGENVLRDAIHQGILDRTFGLQRGEKVYFGTVDFGFQVMDDDIVLHPEIAMQTLQTLTIEVERDTYSPGETVTLIGTAPALSQISIEILGPSGNSIHEETTKVDSTATFSASFMLPKDSLEGSYTGQVKMGTQGTTATFHVQKGAISPPAKLKKIDITVKVPWDRLSEMVRGVFTPLRHEGAQISLVVKIEAESPEGIRRDTLDLRIKETLKQIGAEILEEREE